MPEVEEYEDILALRREIPTIYLDYADDAHYVAEAVIGSDWLAAHDREVAARTLDAAASDYYAAAGDYFYDDTRTPGLSAATWLRERAAALRSGTEGSRTGAALSDFGADAQTAAERRILSEKWEREHPGEDSSTSRVGSTDV